MRDIPASLLSGRVSDNYVIQNWRNAAQILVASYAAELNDALDVLRDFQLHRRDNAGRGESGTRDALHSALESRGWRTRTITASISVDGEVCESRARTLNCFKNRVGLRVEPSRKGQAFGDDLDILEALFHLGVLDVGIVVGRANDLRRRLQYFDRGVRGAEAAIADVATTLLGLTTTNDRNCPLLAFGFAGRFSEVE